MVRGLILFYLNLKPTHGYEIQKFIQISGIDRWTKIQSGSIYYALTKLEKEGNIEAFREERTGSRVRKLYRITEKGKQSLQQEMRQELSAPITNIGSEKFIISPILCTLSKEEMIPVIKKHIEDLKEQEEFWTVWKQAKAEETADKLTRLSFGMALESIQRQIEWHEELLSNMDYYVDDSKTMPLLIKKFDSGHYEGETAEGIERQSLDFVKEIRAAVEQNPKKALENLDRIIEELKSQV